MSMLLTKFKYYDLDEDDYVDIEDATKITINLGSDIKNNSMSVELRNDPVDVTLDGSLKYRWVGDDGTSTFKAIKATPGTVISEELIEIYANITDTNPNLDIESFLYNIFTGVITKGKVKDDNTESRVTLECKDRNSVALDAVTRAQPFSAGDGFTAPKIIKSMIQNLGDNVGSKQWAFDSNGDKVQGYGFIIDAALFSDRIKRTSTATSVSTNLLKDSGATFTSQVAVGDMVRNTVTNSYAIINAINSDIELLLSKDIFLSTEGYEVSNGFIQDTRPDGTAFPDISFAQLDKPVIQYVASLSQISKTNSLTEQDNNTLVIKRGMRTKLDRWNRFHYYVPEDTPEHIMNRNNIGPISPDVNQHYIYTETLNNEIDDKINFIIYTAGTDMDNDTIKSFQRAPFSGVPNAKESKRDWPNIARYMKYQDFSAGNITRNEGDDYNYPAGYPMTPAWDPLQRSVANDAGYNDNFIEVALSNAIDNCKAIFQQRSNPRWKGTIQLRGLQYQVGDLVQYTDKSKGLNNRKLRINQVSHIIESQTGWTTTLTVEEDELELIL